MLTAVALGALLGVRHSVEPDHLAAVSTLVIAERSPARGALLGALWGVGHTLALLAVGVALALLDTRLPPRLAEGFELAVAIMLILLGILAVRRALRAGVGPAHGHRHGPLIVGVVHGLAGSGSLTALVLAGLPSTAARLGYIVLFGLGLVAGMALLSGLAGVPLSRAGRSPQVARALGLATGALSAVLGIGWGWPLVGGWLA